MEYVTDLHLHSKYSRAVSQQMILSQMAQVARRKGLDILTASDWTHPLWFKEISLQLEEASEGLYRLKNQAKEDRDVRFMLSTELSSIYKQGEKLRRIHNLVFAPSLHIAEKISKELLKRGCNLMADGRPIIGLSSKALLELILGIDERCMLVPCHAWTPHFGIYGSASGFDSLDEAFGDLSKYIYAIETGLSSDPEMNWLIKELDNRAIVSFSDAHSLPKMGREATVLVSQEDEEIGYQDIRLAFMRKKGKLRIGYTIEFYPEEGKYHFSGHRNCKVVVDPEKVAAEGNICPVCKRRMTEGVLFRVQQLSGQKHIATAIKKQNDYGLQWFTDPRKLHPPYVKLVPLLEIVAEGLHSTTFSQKVQEMFSLLTQKCGSEMDILLKTPLVEIEKVAGHHIADGVDRVRRGTIIIDPGYDGEYGKVAIWQEEEVGKRKEKSEEIVPQLTFDL